MKRKLFKPGLLITISIVLFLVILSFVLNGFDVGVFSDYAGIAVTFAYAAVLTLVNTVFFMAINKRYDWKTDANKLLLLGIFGSIVLTVVAYALCRFVQFVLIQQRETAAQFLASQRAIDYVFVFLITLVVTLVMHAFYFYKAFQERKVDEQKFIAGTATAKFDALKNQLDPHFLFNSLNVLSGLIDEDPKSAQKFTAELSKIYRYVLEQKNKALVSLDDELRFARTYVDLLKKRFENDIRVNLPEESSAPEAKIIPLSLQLVLENAVKHNVISSERPLEISIEEIDGCLLIKNRLQPKKYVKKGAGVGLENIRQRYALLTDKRVEVSKTASEYSISLPILTEETLFSKAALQEREDLDEKRKRVAKRVRREKEFRSNWIAFAVLIPFLVFINLYGIFTGEQHRLWVLIAILAWGIALCFHYIKAYGHKPVFGKRWESAKIREFLDRRQTKTGKPEEPADYKAAKAHIRELSDFYKHLIVYCAANLFMAGLNYYSNGFSSLWFLWPLAGWGVGLAFKAANAFRPDPPTDGNWEKRKIEKYMKEEN